MNIQWNKNIHSNAIFVIRVTEDKTRAITGSWDQFVKCISLHNQEQLWEFKMNSIVWGLSIASNDSYLLALSYKKQLVVLSSDHGNQLLQFTNFANYCQALRVNERTNDVLVGTRDGKIERLKLSF